MKITFVAALALCLAAAPSARCDDELCEDDRGDAGSLAATALRATGVGPLRAINGSLSLALEDARRIVPDLEDLYLVQILDPAAFLAQTVVPGKPPLFDSSLFLFDPCALGNLGNQQKPGMPGTPFALLLPMANDATGFTLQVPGPYFLGVTGGLRVPASQFGPIFQFGAPGEISGPDGPGNDAPLASWDGQPAQGNYRVVLEGVVYLGFQTLCKGDLDANGAVAGDDLGLLLSAWGLCPPDGCPADLDRDGIVSAADLGLLLSDWGVCPVVGTPCGDPAAGSCLEADGTPGCEDPCCCTKVCQLKPNCCELGWDEGCVIAAMAVCP